MLAELFVRFPSFGAKGQSAYKPGLDRVRTMLGRTGNPQTAFTCIHVAGTNGKGSTCNMLAANIAASGLKVGLYTSPHILDFRERMRTITIADGKSSVREVPRGFVWDFIRKYREDMDELDLSFFEITTVMAFSWFAQEKVGVAVIETGLGGRLDATNVITPSLSVITNIGYDHMDLLGPTLKDIAGEKAGIIKPGVPVVIGESSPETDGVFSSRAAACGSDIFFADRMNVGEEILAGMSEALPLMDLRGIYQEKNLRTVCCALLVAGMQPDFDAIRRAASICDFHGRWEKLSDSPCTICDIGHNEHGLKYNFRQLESLLDSGKYSDLVMVYGSVRDKDVDAVLKILPRRSYIYFTAAANHRAMPSDQLYARAGRKDSEAVPDVKDAVRAALDRCSSLARPLLYIGGSTYVVSEAVPLFKDKK